MKFLQTAGFFFCVCILKFLHENHDMVAERLLTHLFFQRFLLFLEHGRVGVERGLGIRTELHFRHLGWVQAQTDRQTERGEKKIIMVPIN